MRKYCMWERFDYGMKQLLYTLCDTSGHFALPSSTFFAALANCEYFFPTIPNDQDCFDFDQ